MMNRYIDQTEPQEVAARFAAGEPFCTGVAKPLAAIKKGREESRPFARVWMGKTKKP
jgi:hypothetical protein